MRRQVPIRWVARTAHVLRACLLCVGGSLWAQNHQDLALEHASPAGIRTTAWLESGELLVGSGYQLLIWDLAAPAEPHLLASHLMEGNISDLEVRGSWCFATTGFGGLAVVDCTDPEHPLSVANLALEGWASGVALQDDLLAVSSQLPDRLWIFSIADPEAPLLLGELAAGNWNGGLSLDPAGEVCFLLSNWGGMVAADISDPAAPTELGQVIAAQPYLDLDFLGDLALISSDYGGLVVCTMEDPLQPQPLGQINPTGQVRGVDLCDSLAVLATGFEGCQVVDLRDPTQPQPLGGTLLEAGFRNFAHTVCVRDSLASLACDTGVALVDLDNPSAPAQVSLLGLNSVTGTLAGRDSLIAVVEDWQRIVVYTLDDPPGLLPRASLDLSEWVQDLDWSGNRLAILGREGTLWVARLAEDGLTLEGELQIDGDTDMYAVRWDPTHDLILATGSSGLVMVAVTEDGRLNERSRIPSYGPIYSVDVQGDLAAAGASGGALLVDLADPFQPAVRALHQLAGAGHQVRFHQGLLAVLDTGFGLRVIDPADPDNPQALGSHVLEGIGWDLAMLDGDRLAVVDAMDYQDHWTTIVRVLDGWPAGPFTECAWRTLEGWDAWLHAWNNQLVAGNDVDGILLLRPEADTALPEPPVGRELAGPQLLPAVPNPFNPTTTLSFHVDGPGEARLELFDLAGRRIDVLWDGPVAEGTHRVRLEAGDLASGLYLARLTVGGLSHTQRIALIR